MATAVETARKKIGMKRRHKMPFGAECRDDGSVRFRLWAPAAHKVEICLTDSNQRLAMNGLDGGWFELNTHAAKPGTKYKFRINDAQEVPDPASRFQPDDVHGPSQVIRPTSFDWQDYAWRGRRWEEAASTKSMVGPFWRAGPFPAARERLDYLGELGVTALEIM